MLKSTVSGGRSWQALQGGMEEVRDVVAICAFYLSPCGYLGASTDLQPKKNHSAISTGPPFSSARWYAGRACMRCR